MTAKRPMFRADHVGSMLRPPELLAARQKWEAGQLGRMALKAMEDKAILDVIKLQEDAGMPTITDGEFRRENWWIDFISQVKGVEITAPDAKYGFKTGGQQASGYVPKNVRTVGKVASPGPVTVEDWKFVQAATKRMAKMTIPSPTRMHFHGGREAIDAKVYPRLDAYWDDVAKVYQAEIAALEAAGCKYVQLDDPVLTYLLDDRQREQAKQRGEDPDALVGTYARLINSCIARRKPDTHVAIHLCRGNAKSSWLSQGSYDRFAEALFPALNVDGWLLEYDDDRSGGFEPLRFMPKDRAVVLGLVTTKFGRMEDKGDVKRRIDQATKFMPLDKLALSPQCGFASVMEGNLVTVADESAKLGLVAEVAREVWGTI
jgi:5-methyltetrahydropteroyltriglutamate--homocysteine methyltransferase